MAVIGMSRLFGVSLSPRDWTAVGLLSVGLALFAFCLSPTDGGSSRVPGAQWAIGLSVLSTGQHRRHLIGSRSARDVRAAMRGLAADTGYGAAAILFSTAGPAGNITTIATTWQTYAAIVCDEMGARAKPHPRNPYNRRWKSE